MDSRSKARPQRPWSNRCNPVSERIARSRITMFHHLCGRRASMNSTGNASSTHSSRKTSPEEYDLLILGSGTGSKLIAWTFGGQGQRVAVVERKYIGGSCPNIACLQASTLFILRRLHRTCAGVKSSASQGMVSGLICLPCVTESARWHPAWSMYISPNTNEAEPNSSSAPDAS